MSDGTVERQDGSMAAGQKSDERWTKVRQKSNESLWTDIGCDGRRLTTTAVGHIAINNCSARELCNKSRCDTAMMADVALQFTMLR
ncbi:unnamed protein product [Sphagnum balticum]